MAPLVVLILATVAARTVGALGVEGVASWSSATALGLAAMFILTGLAHFTPARRAGLVAIVPPRLPHPQTWVTLTGILELIGAAMLLTPPDRGPWRVLAAWGLTALLLAMFPANVYAARRPRAATAPHTPLLRRTAMQCVFLAATVFVALTAASAT